jgi:hypothetical protein
MRPISIGQIVAHNRSYVVVRSVFYAAVIAAAMSLLEFHAGLAVSGVVVCFYLAGTLRALHRIETARTEENSGRSLESFHDTRRHERKRQLTHARAGSAAWLAVTVALGLIERSRLRQADYVGLLIVACMLLAVTVYAHLRLKQIRPHID